MGKFDQNKLGVLKKIDRIYKLIYLRPKNSREYMPIDKLAAREIIIMGMMMIGDTIMTLPALRVIKKNFPNAQITIVGGGAVKAILENQHLIDNFIIVKSPWLHKDYSFKNLLDFLSSLFIINRKKYDLAIDFRGDWRTIFFMNHINSVRKVSFNYTGGEYMLTDVILPDLGISHYIEEWLYLLKTIGCEITDTDKIPFISLNRQDVDYVSNFKTLNNVDDKFVIGVHPGASQDVKKWSEEKYAELIVKLSQQYNNCKFIIYEGPGEKQIVKRVENILIANNVDFLSVNKSLSEYILLLSACNLVICNDSGAAHVAGAFGVSTVVIFGNVDPRYVTPYGAKHKRIISHQLECKPCHKSVCKFGTNACIAGVEMEEVYNAVTDIINSFAEDILIKVNMVS